MGGPMVSLTHGHLFHLLKTRFSSLTVSKSQPEHEMQQDQKFKYNNIK